MAGKRGPRPFTRVKNLVRKILEQQGDELSETDRSELSYLYSLADEADARRKIRKDPTRE